jgi:hypothetical protein
MKAPPRRRADWTRKLPRPLVIPKLLTLTTLGDVRALLARLPKGRRALPTWRHVAAELEAAAHGADPADVATALRLVLALERVPCRPAQSASRGNGAIARNSATKSRSARYRS